MASKKRVLKHAKTGALLLPAGHPFTATIELSTPTVTPTVTPEVTPEVTPAVTLEASTPTVTLEAPKAVTPTPVKKKLARRKKSVKK
jgi:hypothetical protein